MLKERDSDGRLFISPADPITTVGSPASPFVNAVIKFELALRDVPPSCEMV